MSSNKKKIDPNNNIPKLIVNEVFTLPDTVKKFRMVITKCEYNKIDLIVVCYRQWNG